MNYIDMLLFLALFLITFICAKKGLFYVLAQYIASIAAFILAKLLSVPVASYVYSHFLKNGIQSKLMELFPDGTLTGDLNQALTSVWDSLPVPVQNLAVQFHLQDMLHTISGKTEPATVDQLLNTYAEPFISKALSFISLFVLFLLFSAILKLIAFFLNRAVFKNRDTVVGRFNTLGGAFLGVLRGALTVFAAALLLNIIVSFFPDSGFNHAVSASYLCNYLSTWL